MRYKSEQAMGLIETVGMVPAVEGADKMLKAAEVELISYENIGSTLVTIVVKGDVAACKSSVKAGKEAAAAIGKLTAHNVMPRPISAVGDVVSCHDIDSEGTDIGKAPYNALGLVETFGLVFACEAADAMVKAAEVELVGYENTASGYISILVGGDVAACKTAVDAGVKAVTDMEDGNLYSSVVIPRPHPDLWKICCRYSLDKLLPETEPEPPKKSEPAKKTEPPKK